MDWLLLLFLGILFICLMLICATLITLPKMGDERKNLIKMKAQSYAFTVIIGYILIEIGMNIYRTTMGNGAYKGINPFILLVTISLVYLISLFFTKKKYSV